MRIVFAGTPQVAVPSLHTLVEAGHEVAAVVTRPDAPQGRKRRLAPSPVAAAAADVGIPTVKARRLDEEATQAITAYAPQLGVVVAYGGLVREPLLSTPVFGWINLHFSLLPRWRGAAPVQRSLMAGEATTGAAVFALVPELDAGDVYATVRYDVPPLATAGDVLDALAHRGAYLLSDVVADIAAGTARAVAQSGAPTRAAKLTLEDGRLAWDAPAGQVLAQWQGTTPEPGAFTTVDGARLKVLTLQPADGVGRLSPGRMAEIDGAIVIGTQTDPVAVGRVQPAGRQAMAAADWWRGLRTDDPVAGS